MLTTHQTCPSKYQLRHEEHWTVRRKSAALGFGGALHKGLDAWYKGLGLDAAIAAIESGWPAELPVDDYRTLGKCKDVMRDYTKTYPSEVFKVIGVGTDNVMAEVSFTLDTGMFLPCIACDNGNNSSTGTCTNCGAELEPIEYGGIFDTLIDFNGHPFILEHKSTSRLGSYYFQQFKPNNQITGYCWGGKQLIGRRVGGAIINAIGVYKASATKFERSITTRSDEDFAEWLRDVYSVACEIQHHRRTGYWPRRTVACTLYGQCEFHSVHVLSNPQERAKRLENDYIKSVWDHENRDGDTENGQS